MSPGRELKGKESKMKSLSLANKSEPINHSIHFVVFLHAEEEKKHISNDKTSFILPNLARKPEYYNFISDESNDKARLT